MNKNLYRIVFNRALGLFQVVAEIARRHGRGAGGGASTGSSGIVATVRPLHFALWLALGQVAFVPLATAQIVADPGAPGGQRPTVLEAANGVPLVNVQTPSAAGVSRNSYKQFDVDQQGAILNNSRINTQTQLGGWVQGNPWMGKGTARVILNEVNSSDPSRLHGYVEVAGDRAQVVIANPAGIACDGCGFINANRATLTTGTPVVNGGALEGYRVNGGAIQVSGKGLDASATDYTDLIARSAEVNAGIWAQQLQVTTGANEVSADHSRVSKTAASGDAPAFALDVGALGGMYSQKIVMVGTEHGVGVRNAGTLGAQAGELVVTADGRLENTGAIQAKTDTRLAASGGVANAGTLSAGRELTINTPQDLDNSKGTLNARRVEVNAKSLANRGGAIEQTGTQDLTVRAAHTSNRDGGRVGLVAATTAPTPGGTPGGETAPGDSGGGDGTQPEAGPGVAPLANGALNVAGNLDNDGGRILAGGDIDLTATAGLNNDGGHLGVRQLDVSGGDLGNHKGELKVASSARIQAGQFNNDAGQMQLADKLTLNAQELSNRGGTLQHSDTQDTHLNIKGQLDNSGGTIATNAKRLTVDAGQMVNTGGRLTHAGVGGLALTTDGFSGAGGELATAGSATLKLGDADHRKASFSAQQVDLTAKSFDNRGGKLVATGEQANRLNVTGALDNGDGGSIASNADLSIKANTLGNAGGAILHAGDGSLDISAKTLHGQKGTLASNGALTLKGDKTDLSGGTTQAKSIEVDTGALSTAKGSLTASGKGPLALTARDGLDNHGGTIATNGALELQAKSLDNRAGTVTAAGGDATRITVSNTLDNTDGTLAAAGNTTVKAGELTNQGGTLLAAEQSALAVTVDGKLNNSAKGTLAAGGGMTLQSGSLDNREGTVQQAGTQALAITTGDLTGAEGTIVSQGALDVKAAKADLGGGTTQAKKVGITAESLSTAGGTLSALGSDSLDLTIAGALNNNGGSIAGNGALNLSAQSLGNRQGKIAAAGTAPTKVQVRDRLDNTGGTLAAAGDTTVEAGDLLNQGGAVLAAGDAALKVSVDGLLDNSAKGSLSAGGDMTVAASTLDNREGAILHAGDGALLLTANTLHGAGGTIATNGGLDLTGETTDLRDGTILAARLNIDTGTLTTAGGKLTATGSDLLVVRAREGVDNRGGVIAGNGGLDLSTKSLGNQGGSITAAGPAPSRVDVTERFDNTGGTLAAAGDTTVKAGELLNQGGSVLAAGQAGLDVTVDGLLDNSAKGTLAAGGDMKVAATTLDNREGAIQHAGDGNLDIAADTLNGQSGSIVSNGALSLTGTATDLRDAITQAKRITIDTGKLLHAGGSLIATGADLLRVHARDGLDNNAGTIAGNGALDLQAGSLTNREGKISAAGTDDSKVNVTGQLDNAGGQLVAAGDTTVEAGSLLNQGGTVAAAGDAALTISVDGLLDNSAKGTLAAGGDMQVAAATLDNRQGAIQHAGEGTLDITADTLNGKAGTIASNGALSLTGNQTDLTGATTQAKRITIDTGKLLHAGGSLIATGADLLRVRARDGLDNNAGTIAGNGALDLQAGSLTNREGKISAAGTDDSKVNVTGQLDNTGGQLVAAGDTAVEAGSLLNQGGTVAAAGDAALTVSVDGLLDNSAKGTLAAGGDMKVAATTLDNSQGAIQHAGDGSLDITADTLNGKAGTIASNGALGLTGNHTDLTEATTQARRITIDTGKLLHAGGSLVATGADLLRVTARSSLDNNGGTIAGNGALVLQAGSLTNRDGKISAAGTADSQVQVTGQLDNTSGQLVAAGNTKVEAGSLINQGGTVAAAGEAALTVSVDDLLDNSAKGTLAAGGDMQVAATTLDNRQGAIEHSGEGSLDITADTLNGQAGTIASNGALSLTGNHTDLSHAITQAQRIAIDTGKLLHGGGSLVATGADLLRVSARDGLDNSGGSIAGNGALNLQAGSLANREGKISAAGTDASQVKVAGQLDNTQGTLVTAGDATITAGDLLNQGGTVAAASTAALTVSVDGLLDNSAKGTLAAGGDMQVAAKTLDNRQGAIEHAGEGTLDIAADTLNGKAGTIASNGSLGITGTTTDLTEGTTHAKRIRITTGALTNAGGTIAATGADLLVVRASQRLDNNGGSIATNGALDLRAGSLSNQDGTISAAGTADSQVQVTGQLDNSAGQLVAAGDTRVTAGDLLNQGGTVAAAGNAALTVSVGGLLDNSAKGTLAAGGDMKVAATTLDNSQGAIQHAGDGTLDIAADTLNGKAGTIASNGALGLTGSTTDLTGATTQAKRINIDTGTLTNVSGTVAATGADLLLVRARDGMDNSGGTIAGNGALDLQAKALANRGGKLNAAGSDATRVTVDGQFDNTGGQLVAAGDTTVKAGDLLNQGGTVAAADDAALTVNVDGLLDNSVKGTLAAGGDMKVAATTLNNREGVIQHAGDGTLDIAADTLSGQAGTIASNGALGITGNTTDLTGATTQAKRITIDTGALTNTSGTIAASGTEQLAIRASRGVDNTSGTIAGNGTLDLQAGTLSNQGGKIQAAGTGDSQVTIAGQFDNNNGQLIAAGDTTVKAGGLRNQGGSIIAAEQSALTVNVFNTLDNSGNGTLGSGGDLTVSAAVLDNRQGNIQHSGDGATTLYAGDLQGAGGTIASNGALNLSGHTTDLSGGTTFAQRIRIDTSRLLNMAGKLTAAGNQLLVLRAQESIDNSGGVIAGNGALDVQTQRLTNRDGGTLQAAGTDATRIDVGKTLDNSGGTLAAAGATTLKAGELLNQGGKVQVASESGLTVQVAGNIDNRATGLIASAGKADLTAGSLDNRGGAVNAAGKLDLTTRQALDNRGGKLVSAADVTLKGGTLDNRDAGLVVSTDGNLSVDTRGRTENAGGALQAEGDVSLANAGLGNAGGSVLGANVKVDTRQNVLDNTGGTLASTSGTLTVDSGALNNTGGLLQSATAMRVDTNGQTLTNANAGATGGILSGTTLALTTGDLNNRAGLVHAQGDLNANTGHLDNTGGQFGSSANVQLGATALTNNGGKLQAGNDLSASVVGTANNNAGLVVAGRDLILTAGQILNRDTLGAAPGNPLGLQGDSVLLTANHVDNTAGAIAADQHIGITGSGAGSLLDNTRGSVSSAGSLAVAVSRALNQAGTLLAGKSLSVTADTLGGDGSLLSKGDLTLALQQDFTNDKEITVNGRAVISSAGQLTNRSILQAGELEVRGHNVDNTVTGQISGGKTLVAATDTLTNRGLIDGGQTRIEAGTLDNVGTGRIYGDQLAIGAGVVNNREEDGRAAVIAARERLDIGASFINNREQALIFSAGDMFIGGWLDANYQATGRAGLVLNDSATIESLGSMSLDTTRLLNRNLHFSTELVQVGGPTKAMYIQPKGDPDKHDISEYRWEKWSRAGRYRHLETGAEVKAWTQFDVTRTEYETQVTESAPALIRAGGNLTLHGDELLNDKSHIVVGGALQGDLHNLKNEAVFGEHITREEGTSQYTYSKWRGGLKRYHQRKWDGQIAYNPADIVQTIALNVSKVVQNTAGGGSGFAVGGRHTGQVGGAVGGSNNATGGAGQKQITEVQAVVNGVNGPGAAQGQNVNGSGGPGVAQGTTVNGSGGPGAAQGQQVAGSDGPGVAQGQVVNGSDGPGAAQGQQIAGTGGPGAAQGQQVAGSTGPDAATGNAVTNGHAPGQAQGDALASIDGPGASQGQAVDAAAGPGKASGQDIAGRTGPGGSDAGKVDGSKDQGPAVIRTVEVDTDVPSNSLFRTGPNAGGYLVETDPRFANYREWLSSDYLMSQLGYDPATMHKRLGDGFYEQKLVRDQIGQLTGRRFLDGYGSDEAQYHALLNAGSTYAKAWNLRPGVALSAEQMAQLTSDIVWLVERDVTLADGTTTRALVPQVYVRVKQGDLDGNGTLIGANSIDLNLKGDLVNSGTIAGRTAVQLTGENLRNLGGRITGDAVALKARTDIDNIGGTLDAGQALSVSAGRDLNITTTTHSDAKQAGLSDFSRTNIDRVAGLYVTAPGGTLVASAGRDVNLVAAQVINAGKDGQTAIVAGRDLNLGTVKVDEQENNVRNASNYLKQGYVNDVGTTVQAAGDVRLQAGRDLTARAATVTSEHGALVAVAQGDVNLLAGEASSNWSEGRKHKSSGLFGSSSRTTRDSLEETRAVSTTFSGNTVAVQGQNVTITGSNVVSDAGTVIVAKNDLTIQAAAETFSESHFKETKKSGVFSGGGIGVTIGKQMQSNDQKNVHTSAASSTVGSLKGDVTLASGNQYRQIGSDVVAPEGDISVVAKSIEVSEARQSSHFEQDSKFKQSGLSVSITSPVISAVETTGRVASATNDTDSGRMKALGAAMAALNAKDAYEAGSKIADAAKNGEDLKEAASVGINISLGSSKSESRTTQTSGTAHGSTVKAGGNVSLVATGAGQDSNILVRGSEVSAGKNATLMADNRVDLVAAENHEQMQGKSSSSSASVGIGINFGGDQNGITLNASGSKGRGKSNGNDDWYTHSSLKAGDTMLISSGGDTNIRGAKVAGNTVKLDVGGDLNIESLQNTSTYASQDKNTGGGISVCIPPLCAGTPVSANINIQKAKTTGNYASVEEQSGIRAGDGGFDIKVKGNTDLKGALIASNQAAIDSGKNRLETASLTTSDIENHAEANAKSSGISLSSDYLSQGKYGIGKTAIGNAMDKGSASDSSTGNTKTAVSEGAVIITDEARQIALTGTDAETTVSALNRDTANAHVAAQKMDIKELEQQARAEQIIKTAVTAQAFKFSDDAYRTMFLEKHSVYRVEQDANGNIVYDTERKAKLHELTAEEKTKMQAGAGGQVRVGINGIFNDADAAAYYASQHNGGKDQPLYMVSFPKADSMVGELMVAGYQKFLENDFWGLSNSTQEVKKMMERYGNTGLMLDAHSRGSMTVGNALQSHSRNNGDGKLINTDVNFYGPAYSAQKAADLLYELSAGMKDHVSLQNHGDDFVGSILGSNPSTHTQIPADSNKVKEWIRMFSSPGTVHSCYGAAGPACIERYGDARTMEIKAKGSK